LRCSRQRRRPSIAASSATSWPRDCGPVHVELEHDARIEPRHEEVVGAEAIEAMVKLEGMVVIADSKADPTSGVGGAIMLSGDGARWTAVRW
jgi:hypothetical protein